jgi:hypothetical protein
MTDDHKFSFTDNEPELEIKSVITKEIADQARIYVNRILKYFFAVGLGAIAAVIWNLNGEIYKAVGETSVSTKSLDLEIARLNNEVSKLQKELDTKNCLENNKVKDKAGCYRVN